MPASGTADGTEKAANAPSGPGSRLRQAREAQGLQLEEVASSDAEPIQFVSLKVVGRGIAEASRVPERVSRAREAIAEAGERRAYFGPEHGWRSARLLPRAELAAGPVAGPLIVEEYDTTTVVRPGWTARIDGWNNIILERDASND